MLQNINPVAPTHQRGAAILVFMLLVFLASTYWMLGNVNATTARLELDKQTARALSLAKQALIGRAAIDGNRPGSLPCPDANGDGVAELFVGSNCPTYIGRLPWKTLDLPDLRDGYGRALWYVLSPALRDHAVAQPINSQKSLELTFDGTLNIAAVIISPGPPLADQNGRPSNLLADYLDGSNRDGDFAYISGPPSAMFNDQAMPVTREELFRTVNERVLAEVRGPDNNQPAAPAYGLRHFLSVNPSLPFADSGSDGHGDATAAGNLPYIDLALDSSPSFPPYAWMSVNGWLALVGYQRTTATSARVSLGSNQMDVVACTSSPCP